MQISNERVEIYGDQINDLATKPANTAIEEFDSVPEIDNSKNVNSIGTVQNNVDNALKLGYNKNENSQNTNFAGESPTERAERIEAYAESHVEAFSYEIREQYARGKNFVTLKILGHTIHFQKKSDGSITAYVEGERTQQTGFFIPNEEVGTYDSVEEAYSAVVRYLANEKGVYETYPKTFHQYNDLYNERHPSVDIVENGDYTSPEYETAETRKPIVATDFKADKQRRADAAKEYGLSNDEASRLSNYVEGLLCYRLNKKMIAGTLTDGELRLVDSIRNALLKMPEYSGRTYRNLQFKSEKEYNGFLSEYTEGTIVELKAFTSTSKLPNGYTKFGNGVVHLVIDGVSGRDVADTFGLPRQQEVIYLPDTLIEIKKITIANDGNPLIFVQEVKRDELIREKAERSTVNNRPETGGYQGGNNQRVGFVGNRKNRSGVSGEVRSGIGRNVLLSERGKSADSGNVLGEHGGIKPDKRVEPRENSSEMIENSVKKTLKPEIVENAELTGMLQDKFGNDMINGLATEIMSTFKKNGSIGEFEALFTDGGQEIYNVLNNSSQFEISYSTSESEDYANEQSGNNLLSGSSKRGNDASTGKQAERISSFKQKIKGKSEAERQSTAKELLAKGQTEKEVIDVTQSDKKGKVLVNLVNTDAHNDDMLSIVEAYTDKGIDVRFYLGHGKVAFDGADDFLVNAFKVGSSKMYIRYDGKFSPQTYGLHEDVHIEWNSEEMTAAKDYVLNSLSDKEKENILASERYKNYSEIYDDDKEAVWQEFIADVFSGMSSYTENYIDVVADYWYGGEAIDRYSPAVYNDIIDAGGINTSLLNNVGLSENDDISIRFTFAGKNANNANLSLLERAKEMQVIGKSKESIFKETGWFKGEDGKWRFEIDDSSSEFFLEKLKQNGESTLGEIWNNEAVYEVYPFLKDMPVKIVNFGDDSHTLGEYDPKNKIIRISDAVLDTDIIKYFSEDYEKAVVHEVQHTIQHYEDFEFGGNPEEALEYIREQAQYFLGDNDETFQQLVSQGTLQEIYDYVDDFLIKKLRSNNIEEVAKKVYYNLHGEREARESEKRLGLSSEDRLKTYPNYGKGAILRKNDTKNRNQAIGVSETSREISEHQFVENLYSDSRRGMGNKAVEGMGGTSRFSKEKVKFSTAETDAEELTPERKKEIFEQFDKDRAGVDKPTQKQMWGERAAWVAHNMTRVFPNIPERGERGTFFAEFRKSMIQWKNLPTTASFMVQDKLNKMTEGLTHEEFKTFSELVYFLDLQEEAQIQKERGYTEILLP